MNYLSRIKLIDPKMDDKIILMQELRQAKVRCIFTAGVFFLFVALTFMVSKYQDNFITGEVYKVFAAFFGLTWGAIQLLLFKFYKNIRPSVARILVGQFVDAAATSLCLSAGNVGTLFFVTYLWIILGNGMRFGPALLITCQILSLITFGINLVFTPYWHEHIELAFSYIFILILIPLYFGTLVRRLSQIRDELVSKEKFQVDLLKQMDNLKTTFFANISHEFRTPIALTLGSLDMLERNPQDAPRQIPIVRRNQNRLLQLINQILDLEKMEHGGLELKFSPLLNLDQFLKKRAEQFQAMAVKKSLTLTVEISTQLKAGDIYVDPDNLDKVIFNLLSNAFKFTKQGGIIFAAQVKDNKVAISVRDSGMGIREDQLPFIFDRFRQATGSESKDYAGTGIGLSLVQEIIKLHGGEIQVQSQYGEGTTFTIIFPLGKAHLNENQISPNIYDEDQALEPQLDLAKEGVSDTAGIDEHKLWNETSLNQTDRQKKTILYVDDNYDLRNYMIDLVSASYNLILAWDGIAALEILEKNIPDLILSDLMMPKLDGAGLLRTLRKNTDLNDIPFVILTAKATQDAKFDLLEAGADDFLFKPFSREELLVRIRNLLILREKTLQNRRELLEAKKIQRSLLPPDAMEFDHASVSVVYKPCETLSGDFYDVLTNKQMMLSYVADVTSHGTSAAQITYLIKSTIKAIFEQNPKASVSETLKEFAKRYVDFNLDYGVAIQIFKFDFNQRVLSFSNSNSPTAFLKNSTGFNPLVMGPSPLIDAKFFNQQKCNFEEKSFPFNSGDAVFFFTDGCFELRENNGRGYDDRQFSRDLQKVASDDNWRDLILQKMKDHQGEDHFSDDITILRLTAK